MKCQRSLLNPSRLLVGLTALLFLLMGCTTDVTFKVDKRLSIISPEERSTVSLPFELRWEIEDFTVTGPDGQKKSDAGYFAVFLDRSPMAPGENLRSIAEDDEPCLRTPGCPDEAYLNQLNIYTTTEKMLEVTTLQDTRPRERPEAKDWHEATIVLLNGISQRIGESTFSVRFVVERSGLQ